MNTHHSDKKLLFTDLFYAAVIGYAVSKAEAGKELSYYFFILVTFMFVIEDWYTYYKRVVPVIIGKNYSLYNIIVEFLILFSWSVCFSAVIDSRIDFSLWFALFMALRWWGGVRYHYRKETLLSMQGIGEHLYGVSSIVAVLCYFWMQSSTIDFSLGFTIISASWLILMISNWNLYFDSMEK